MKFRLAALVLSLCFGIPSASAGTKPWIEVRSQHFRVLTNGSQGDARRVAYEFEQMRYVFVTQFPKFRLESGAPLLVLAARDESTEKALEPALWKMKGAKPVGEFHHGWEKQYVMVRLDTWGQGAHEVVYHEYAHSVLHLNSHWLPVWLDEGMAEFFAYSRFRQHEIYIGAPTERYRTIVSKPLLPIETLISADRRSPYYHDEDKIQMFYAESWGLVHFMIFGPGMEGGKRLDEFFSLVQQGTEQKKAFQQVFGDFRSMDKALNAYLRQFVLKSGVLANPPQIDEKSIDSRSLSEAETEAELGGFHLWTHDLSGARLLLEQALMEDSKLGLAHEAMGFLRFVDGKDSDATTEFSKAYELDNNLYLSLFAKTMLSPTAASNATADQNTLRENLSTVLKLNPKFAPAYVELARLAVRRNDLRTALALSRKAEELEPSRAGYHLMSGHILLRMGRGAEAAGFAKFVAERWVGADHDEAVELWNKVPTDQRPTGDSISDMVPQDTKTVVGTVKSVNCSENDQGWSFVLTRDDQPLTFHRKGGFGFGFSDTLWYGADHFSLCHHLEGIRAVVRYRPAADASYAGDVAEIEIRDGMPEPLGEGTTSSRPGDATK